MVIKASLISTLTTVRRYSPRVVPLPLRPIIAVRSRERRAERKAIIDAVMMPSTDPDADTPFTPVSIQSVLDSVDQPVVPVHVQKSKEATFDTLSKFITNLTSDKPAETMRPDTIVIIAEAETTRRQLAKRIADAFGQVQVEPVAGGDGGWTCCLVEGRWFVHLVDRASHDYYQLNSI